MKAYQVFRGDFDKHGRQRFDLVATYLDRQRAIDHTEKIAQETPLHGDVLEFDGWWAENKYCSWSAIGWEKVVLSQFEEIEITE